MNTPPLLLGATLLFWGWQTGLFLLGASLAAALEGSRFVSARWEFSPADFRRIWTLCTLFFLAATIYAFVAHEGTSGITSLFENQSMARRSESLIKTSHSVLALLQWMPVIFFPMVAAQIYSNSSAVDLRAMSWILRRRRLHVEGWTPPSLNLCYPYLLICLLATSTTNSRALFFFVGLCFLLAWGLWAGRNKRFSTVTWGASLACAVTLGFFGHVGLNHLQKVVQNMDAAWLTRFSRQESTVGASRTALGSIGRIKLSSQIVLRVTPETKPVPFLLREASYNLFKSPLWYSAQKEFAPLIAENDETTWLVGGGTSTNHSVLIARFLKNQRGLLPIPHGTERLERLPVFTLKSNALGVLRVDVGPGFVHYRARFGNGSTTNSIPEPDDLEIPRSEQPAVQTVAKELGLMGLPHEEILDRVRRFFVEQFRYSTYLETPIDARSWTPLGNFLLHQRAGHCEFFASATVLLLRQAGIPTRYAVGYSVQEQKGSQYVVRGRHAHAWALVYVKGAWHDFDTTPPSWNAVEAQQASFWEPVRDFFSRLYYEFSKWRWGKTNVRRYVVWIIIPPLLLAAGQLILRKQWRRLRGTPKSDGGTIHQPGKDSEFYRIEEKLSAAGYERKPGESGSAWMERLRGSPIPKLEPLQAILALHYRYRFDPKGLDPETRLTLKRSVESWLQR